MKKITVLLFVSFFVVSIASTAEKKKSPDEWKKEIEGQIGKVTWGKAETVQNALKKAKEFKSQETYYINGTKKNYSKILITTPDKRGVAHTSSFGRSSLLNGLAKKSFSELEKNDIFITTGDSETGLSYIWLMESQKIMKNVLQKHPNGGVYLKNSNYSNLVHKYPSWTSSSTKPNNIACVYGKTQYYSYPSTRYDTIYDSTSSCLSILITNFDDFSLSEIKLILLGKSTNIPFIKTAIETRKETQKTIEEQVKNITAEKEASDMKIQELVSQNLLKEIKENKPALGLVVMSDGTYRSPYKCQEENGIFPVGVICKVNDDCETGLMLGLYNSGKNLYRWAGKTEPKDERGIDYRDIEYPDLTRATIAGIEYEDFDGSDNWNYICNFDPEGASDPEKFYPAYTYVLNYAQNNNLTGTIYGNEWFMPTFSESNLLAENYALLNTSLKIAGGNVLMGIYWTSSTFGPFTWDTWLDSSISTVGNHTIAPYRYHEKSVCVMRKF